MTKFFLETGFFVGDTGFRATKPERELTSLEGFMHFAPAAPCPGGFFLEPLRACFDDPFLGAREAQRVRVEGEPGELATLLQDF